MKSKIPVLPNFNGKPFELTQDRDTELNIGNTEAAEPMSLYEYCRQESGLTGVALDRYINRHYGHG